MKCVIDRAALLEALAATSSVLLTRTPKPILQCIRVTAEKQGVILTAYDQEVGLRCVVKQVDVTKTGETLVPGERLFSIVRESADETLAFEADGDVLQIRGADSYFKINGQNVREFPPVPDMEGESDFVVKVAALREAVDKTLFAAARENTRYAINGVLWEKSGKHMNLVATDGRRLAMSGVSLEKAVGEDRSAIVPTKALSLLGKLHFDADEAMDVQIKQNQVLLRTSRATISSVLVEGHFPKYQDVIPRDNEKKIPMQTETFRSAVRRAALLANLESKGVRIAISSEGMVLTSRSPEQGEARINVTVDYKGAPIEIGFNPEFLLDALKVCDAEIMLELKDPGRPGVIKSGPHFTYVVMPVNLS